MIINKNKKEKNIKSLPVKGSKYKPLTRERERERERENTNEQGKECLFTVVNTHKKNKKKQTKKKLTR